MQRNAIGRPFSLLSFSPEGDNRHAQLFLYPSTSMDQTDYFASDVYEDLRGQLPKFKAKARDYNLPKQSKF